MTTAFRAAVNRRPPRRTQLSPGPKTAAGKAVSSRPPRRTIKHGLLSRQLLLPGESRRHLTRLRNQMYAALAPGDVLETLLIDRITGAMWRLRRLGRVETELFQIQGERCHRRRQHGMAFIRGDAAAFR